jgi:hypothetical protein
VDGRSEEIMNDRIDIVHSVPARHPRHTFADLADALEFAKPLAKKHKGQHTVSVVRRGQFYAVTVGNLKSRPLNMQAILDDILVGYESGFGLLEVLVSMSLSLLIIGALATVLLANARLAATLAKTSQEDAMARSRLSRQLVDLDTSVDGVTIALDESTPEEATCRLFHLTTSTPSGHTFDAYATRGCQNQ